MTEISCDVCKAQLIKLNQIVRVWKEYFKWVHKAKRAHGWRNTLLLFLMVTVSISAFLPFWQNRSNTCIVTPLALTMWLSPLAAGKRLSMICLDVQRHWVKQAPFKKIDGRGQSQKCKMSSVRIQPSFDKLNKTERKKNTILVAEGLKRVISPTIARVKH